nr:uncharacterized protein LOC111515050 [Leptinotarsa decemlineata]
MEVALVACRDGMPVNAAARQYNISVTTLLRRIKAPIDQPVDKKLGRYRSVFSKEQEKILADYVLQMEERLFGLTIADLKSLAYQFAVRIHISQPFINEKQIAEKDWVYGFLKRNTKLSLRLPEKTSAARASAFNEVNVNTFFDLLDHLYGTCRYSPNRIYNCDEAGITTVPNKPSKVISKKGKKQVGVLSSSFGISKGSTQCDI